MRENLRALGKTEEEKQLAQRYVAKISQGKGQLERLRLEEKKLKDDRDNLQRQLDERIRKLAAERRLNWKVSPEMTGFSRYGVLD